MRLFDVEDRLVQPQTVVGNVEKNKSAANGRHSVAFPLAARARKPRDDEQRAAQCEIG